MENQVKRKLKEKQEITSVFLRIPDPTAAELMAAEGIDLLVIDQEHYVFPEEMIRQILGITNNTKTTCLIRVSQVEQEKIGKLLDAGAGGILLADARDAKQVKELVNAVKYAPIGKRGVSTESRSNGYGLKIKDLKAFPGIENQNTIIGVIIETQSASEELDEILKIKEVDFLSVGTMDLTYACNVPGETKHQSVIKLKEEIYKKITASGKSALDKAFEEADIEAARKNGINCFYLASDMELLKRGIEHRLSTLGR